MVIVALFYSLAVMALYGFRKLCLQGSRCHIQNNFFKKYKIVVQWIYPKK